MLRQGVHPPRRSAKRTIVVSCILLCNKYLQYVYSVSFIITAQGKSHHSASRALI